MSADLTVIVNVGSFHDVPEGTIRDAVRRAVMACGANAGEFSITLLDDDGIQALNEQYLGHDRPTDVISFSLGDDERPLGDVYLGYECAERQASEVGVALDEELARLAIHGVLHVFGHDHPEGADRVDSPMYALQERLVTELFTD